MAKLSINLLPPELEEQKKKRTKGTLVATISIVFLLVIVGIAAVVLAIRISQGVILGNVKKDLDSAKSKATSPEYVNRQDVVVSLKNRLDNIATLLSQETFSSYAFSLINQMAPSNVKISSISIDNKGLVKVVAESNDINALEIFFNNVINPETNQKKIVSAHIEGFSRLKSDVYRAELSLTLVGVVTAAKAAPPPPASEKK